MKIELNHTIIPCSDKKISSRFYARILGFEDLGKFEHFRAVKVNKKLTLLFSYNNDFTSLHYAFKVDDQSFDKIFKNIQNEDLLYGSDAFNLEDKQLNHWHGGRGLYFRDPNGHILELLTKDED